MVRLIPTRRGPDPERHRAGPWRHRLGPLRHRPGPLRHAVVTGGSSGIGLALVERLLDRGVAVSVLALDNDDLAALRRARQADAGSGPGAAGARLHLAAVDVRDREAVEQAVAGCLDVHGEIDLLVTSAGVTRPGRFLELAPEEFERQLAVNYLGTLWAVRAVAPGMVAAERGSIVLISSFAGLTGVFGYSAYAPSKYAVRGLAETLRSELGPKVHVAAVYPTDVDTPMLAGEEPLKPAETQALSGTAAVLRPEQVADAILRGVARSHTRILCDRQSAALAWVAAALPGVAERVVDRILERAR